MKLPCLAVALALCLGATVVAQTVPTGFIDESVVTGLVNPVAMNFANDGRLFVTEKDSGRIYVCNVATGTRTLVGTVSNVATGSERGLLGICVDPGWPARPYVYVCYSHTSPASMRVARFTIGGDVGVPTSLALTLGVKYDILTTIPDSAFNHNGGTVVFGPDGMLYASFGDDANNCAAQVTTDGRGVILRMDVSGLPAGAGGPPSIAAITPAAGNPFPGSASFGPITYTYGLRNPFRIDSDPVTGNLYVADVGQNAVEEYNEITGPGQNMGWPRWEGNNSFSLSCPPSVTPVAPIVAVAQSQGWFSIMSFAGRYRNQPGGNYNFGAAYEGDVFYHDYYSGHLRRLTYNGSTWQTTTPTNWGTGFQNVSDGEVGPDGAIYYTRNVGAGAVRRIRSNANAPQLLAIAGHLQPGNAGRPALEDLKVRLETASSVPIVGSTIDWTITSGGGTLGAASSVTDANGEASVGFTFDPTVASNTVVTARLSTDPAITTTFTLIWRGMTATYVPTVSILITTFRGSQTSSPYILAADLPVASPYVMTQWGDIWTGLLNPGGPLVILDGTGLFAPADPNLVTGTVNPIDTNTYNIPPSVVPVTFTLQAYGVDTSLIGDDRAIIITNRVNVNI